MLYLYITTLVALCNIEKVNKPYRYRLYNGFYGIEVYGALKSIESHLKKRVSKVNPLCNALFSCFCMSFCVLNSKKQVVNRS